MHGEKKRNQHPNQKRNHAVYELFGHRCSHLVLVVSANKRLFIVVFNKAVLQAEVSGFPAGEVLALLHEVTLTHERPQGGNRNSQANASRAMHGPKINRCTVQMMRQHFTVGLDAERQLTNIQNRRLRERPADRL